MADKQSVGNDPIVHGSLGWHLAVASAVLGLSVLWAFYDEMYAKRPWVGYQKEFVARYTKHLESAQNDVASFEAGLQTDPELEAIKNDIAVQQEKVRPQVAEIDVKLAEQVNPRVLQLTKAMQAARSEVMALTYRLEHAEGDSKKTLQEQLEEVKSRKIEIADVIMLDGNGQTESVAFVYAELADALDEAKARKAELIQQRAELDVPARELRALYDQSLDRKRPGLSSLQLGGLIRKMENFKVGIRQIHVPDPIGLVDRCESCHLGIREPVSLTASELGGVRAKAFVSHPQEELLHIHDPELFGCTTCHGGNGAATISVKEGHGKIKHWLWPLFDKENIEAGCVQCHEDALVLNHAETLNAGKELFRYRGCWGCHPRDGFDVERAQQRIAAQAVQTVAATIDQTKWATEQQYEIADDSDSSDEEVQDALTAIEEFTLRISGLESELLELERREQALGKQLKNVGPSLRPIKQKLRPEWLTQWIQDPRHFRPTTRMPVFRLPEEHLRAISAAVWQMADAPDHDAEILSGDTGRGKELFESRGCLGCHAIEKNAEGDWLGGQFGPELSRMGEKANYDYIVEWIKDTPDWSLMPNLRLSMEDARDIASYVMSMKDKDAKYDASYAHLDDPSLLQDGKMLIRHYGCAGCHDINGFENVGKIGTDLTTEGNKPIERLDFALHTYDAKRKHWYDHKSFFELKLAKPEFFDEGKELENEFARSRMPNFGLSKDETTQLVTFLLGSVDTAVPDRLFHKPTGRTKDITEGWWVIKKYNCEGCHQIVPGQVPDIQKLPQYQGENVALTPPSLVGVGARLNPEWLAKFLRNPAMRDDEPNRNGVRTYLQMRMPTFNLWDEEIGALVRFFEAMANQTTPYFPPHYPDLTENELELAREAFLGMDCLNCHASSAEDTGFDASIIAPSFVHANSRLKPSWTERWILDPAKLMPGTRMPAGLFRHDGERQVVAGQMSDDLTKYEGDHAKLFVRYMNQIDRREANLLKEVKDAEKAAPAAEEQEFFEEDDE